MSKWGAGVTWNGAPRGPLPRLWQFADHELDERFPELRVRGQVVELERKPLEMLIYLLLHAGELVNKEQFVEALWPGRIIEDSMLTKNMAVLRHALDDHEHRLIKTIHGYGYRVDVPMTVCAAAAPGSALRKIALNPLLPGIADF